MALVPFNDWWERPQNQQHFWRTNGDGEAVSLCETPRYIFRQILQRLKEYHDQDVGYGNLLDGVRIRRIGENNQVNLRNYGQPDKARGLACIRQDFLDFKQLVTEVEDRIFQVTGVQRAYSSQKFHDLFTLLNDARYNGTVDDLRRFGFYMRNNPLFLDEAAKFLFFRKVLTIKEFDDRFSTSVTLREIQGWSQDVRHNRLKAVRDYRRDRTSLYPTNYSIYRQPDGSIVFYRNCLGHIRSWNAPFDDAEILHALEDDLPYVIPVWFYALVKQLDLNEQKCLGMCGSSWMEFLSMQPSVFT